MLPHPQATRTDHGGLRASDLSIRRRRLNHFTTAPSKTERLIGRSALGEELVLYRVSICNANQILRLSEQAYAKRLACGD